MSTIKIHVFPSHNESEFEVSQKLYEGRYSIWNKMKEDFDFFFDRMPPHSFTDPVPFSQFEDYLLYRLGHIGIEFPGDNTIYGYGPSFKEKKDEIQRYIQGKRKKNKSTPCAIELVSLFSPYRGIYGNNTHFFKTFLNRYYDLGYESFNLFIDMDTDEAKAILENSNDTYYSILFDKGGEKYNCISFIFKKLNPRSLSTGKFIDESKYWSIYQMMEELKKDRNSKKEKLSLSKKKKPSIVTNNIKVEKYLKNK